MQSEVTKKQDATGTNNQSTTAQHIESTAKLDPAEQSRTDRQTNYIEQAQKVATKMDTEPEKSQRRMQKNYTRRSISYLETQKEVASQAKYRA